MRLDFAGAHPLSISYSGDTRPCAQFVALSQGVDVMIHEATFTDDLQENAVRNLHSTLSEALAVARSAAAKHLILTHFSQRYKKISGDAIQDEALRSYFLLNTVMATDHLRLDLTKMAQYPLVSQLYQQLIPESK